MKNLTISLDDTVLQKIRVSAAEAGMSMSKYAALCLEKESDNAPKETKSQLLSRLSRFDFTGATKNWVSRDEIYDR